MLEHKNTDRPRISWAQTLLNIILAILVILLMKEVMYLHRLDVAQEEKIIEFKKESIRIERESLERDKGLQENSSLLTDIVTGRRPTKR